MLDVFELQIEVVSVLIGMTTELTAIVCQYDLDLSSMCIEVRDYTVV